MEILLFLLLGSPDKNLVPYDKPFWNIFENSPFSGQNGVNWGGRGGPRNFFFIGILFFVLLGSPRKNLKSHDTSFMGFEQRYRCREVIFRCREVIFRCREVIFRCWEVIFRCREVIFRCREVIFQKKWNENSGLPKFAPLAHANRLDQKVSETSFNKARKRSSETSLRREENRFLRLVSEELKKGV